MKNGYVFCVFLLAAFAISGQNPDFVGTWAGISGDMSEAVTLAIGFKDGVYTLQLTWASGERWQGRGYLVKGFLVGGFAYSENDGGFFRVGRDGGNILLHTFNPDTAPRNKAGITFRRTS